MLRTIGLNNDAWLQGVCIQITDHIICLWPCSCGTDVQSHHSSASFLLLAGDWWETGSLPVQGNQVCQLPRFQLQPVSGERLHLWALPQRSAPLPLPGELHQKVGTLTNLYYFLYSLFNKKNALRAIIFWNMANIQTCVLRVLISAAELYLLFDNDTSCCDNETVCPPWSPSTNG